MNPFTDAELLEVLTGVSRSFVLTIRALPRCLRRPVGLAYLLARASDTIADTASTPVDLRAESLRSFTGKLLHQRDDVFSLLPAIKPENPAEQYLLANLDRVITAVEALPEADRAEIVALLEKITRGQELDLLRFPDALEIRALETAADLNEYTYLVAGCVGEFWTRICAAHIPRYARLPAGDLGALGRSFGQGLQLVNILRDLPEDIAKGRCYLPIADLRPLGISHPADLRHNLLRAAPLFETWRRQALQHLEDARLYIEAIRPLRIRFACLIPWAIGIRTLNLLGQNSPLDHSTRLKVPRKEVTRIMRRALCATLSNTLIRKWSLEG